MTDNQLIDITKKLIAIESTTLNPKGLQEAYDFIIDLLEGYGKDITIEQFESNGRPSLLAYKGPVRPDTFRIILNGHLDVVPGKPFQYTATIQDGKLYGRGAYDMKAACVIMADAFCRMVDTVPYALGLQIVTDEENAGKDGTQYQIQQGVRADFVICGECGRQPNTFEIANEAKGIAVAHVRFTGASSHGAYPWRGDNAAVKAAVFLDKLHQRFPVPTGEASSTTVTVTSLTAESDAYTKTPDVAHVVLDARYAANDPNFCSPQNYEALIKEIDPSAEVVKFYDFSSPLYTSPDNPLLRSLKASAERIEGMPFSLVRRHATSDGRFYGAVGNQACEFGIAGEHQHGDQEYITLKAFSDYRATLLDFLSTASANTVHHNTAKALAL